MPDYSDRSGFPRPPSAERGAAAGDHWKETRPGANHAGDRPTGAAAVL